MKKILLATTVLAATAGFAMADDAAATGVAVTGTARMGVETHDTFDAVTGFYTGASDAMFSSRVRIIFTATGETDSGLSFGASVRNDQKGTGNTANGDSTVYISGAFGKLTMGDTGNASDALLGQVSSVGYTGLGSANELGFLAKDTTGALYEYSTGALSFALGAGQVNAGYDEVSAAAKYATDAYSVGVAYESSSYASGDVSQTTLFGSATFSGATVKAKIVDGDMSADTQYALSVDYNMNGVGVTAFYADHQGAPDTNSVYGRQATYGLGASYDLGGGASVAGGVVHSDGFDTVYDLGVKMSF